jgi:16S rRNA (cytosine967-C5)-methyltransferase
VRAGATLGDARDPALAGLAERDRRLAYELSAGILRRQAELDRALTLAHVDPRLHDILRLGLYQLRCLARVPAHAAVSTSVELAREAVGEAAARYVNQALRKLTQDAEGSSGDESATHPEWLVRRWRRQFGAAEAAQLLAWNDERPALTLQPARWDQDTLARRLEEAGIGVTEAPFGAGLRLALPHPPPPSLPGFAEGAFLVQDSAQALLARYAAVPPGTLVYDACGAPGGKAVALERAGARVVAGDARGERLPRLLQTARRCGVAIRVLAADLLSAPFAPLSLPVVLVDAPCTATGTMARHPDARWRLRPGAIQRAAERQRHLLAAAAALVAPGGVLVYATCSLEPEENALVVKDFLERAPEFRRATVAGAVDPALLAPDGEFRTFPPRHGIDGAYAVRLERSR